MSNTDNQNPCPEVSSITHPSNLSTHSNSESLTPNKRRVSIQSSPPTSADMSNHSYLTVPQTGPGGNLTTNTTAYDNHGFEPPRRRISVTNDHAEIGPVRKKSILHHNEEHYLDYEKHQNGDARGKKQSVTESLYSRNSRTKMSEAEDERSWWYMFCLNCRHKDSVPSWSPPGWDETFPHPFCPSYRQFARLFALLLIGLLIWGITFAIAGETAAPGGPLFGLAALCIVANFGGWLVSLVHLPALVGMLLVGTLFQNVGWINFEDEFKDVTSILRKIALVIILSRAGLELDPSALRRLKWTVARLGLIPWFFEAAVVAVTTHYLMALDWSWAFLLGSIIAAVSPAVVVPCLFRLRNKGYGVAKGIPTLIIAVSGVDDAVSVAMFGIIFSIMFSSDSLYYQIAQGPISIIGGLGFGAIWGWLCQYVPEKDDAFAVPLRILMLLGGGLLAVFGSEEIKYDGAGPLGCFTAAFMCSNYWSKQGWEVDENPAATAFQIFWMIFEPILFGITGAQIKLNELDPNFVYVGVGCLLTGIIIRIFVTVIVGIGCGLNLKEKIFTALSWMAKATVQAALGPVALHAVTDDPEKKEFAETVLLMCILSILLTAPIGAVIISLSGPRLLTKTKAPPPVAEGWRRSHRPSIRDISIIDEEEERDVPEKIINRLS